MVIQSALESADELKSLEEMMLQQLFVQCEMNVDNNETAAT